MFRCATVLTAALLLAGPAPAGEFNKKVSVGDAAPTFTGLEGTDGKKHSLSEFKKDVVVVIITCNHCPVAVAYEDRIIAFAKKFGDKVDVVAINVNNNDADKLPKMVERAKEKGFTFPYLYDPSQKIARDLGASVTPEFFVLDKGRKIAYMGALDDAIDNPKVNHLDPAVEATLKGTKVEKTETRARGCSVQYE
jgi:thiol-disulfide isomerase/thioredoxin